MDTMNTMKYKIKMITSSKWMAQFLIDPNDNCFCVDTMLILNYQQLSV